MGIGTQSAEAYVKTGETTAVINGTTGLFLMKYTFGHGSHDLHMPLRAFEREGTTKDALSYALIDGAGATSTPSTKAIILAPHVPIVDGMYVLKAGKKAEFTLVVPFTYTGTSVQSYRLQVTHLPFNFDGSQFLELNKSELAYYTTNPVTFDHKPGITVKTSAKN